MKKIESHEYRTVLVLFNNVFLLMFIYMMRDWKYWGIVPIIITVLFYFVSFSMLVAGMIFIKLPNKKYKCLVFGREGTGMVRRFVTPYADVTGEQLLNTLQIRGKLADGYDYEFTDEEIYTSLVKCKQLLNAGFKGFENKENFDIALSRRQDFCSNATIQLVMQNRYNQALHEFRDCIDDYGKGRNRAITVNEYILYNCILNCFIARLEN